AVPAVRSIPGHARADARAEAAGDGVPMIAERLIRREPEDRSRLQVVDSETTREVPCLNCRLMISSAARYCRRCGTRQPTDRPLEAAPPAPAAPAADAASLPPPLVPLWSPFDRPSDAVLAAPATFRSFAAGSEWAPRAAEDDASDCAPVSPS